MVQAVRLSSTGKHQAPSQASCCMINRDVSPHSIEELAKKHNASMAQISLAWVMAKDGSSLFDVTDEIGSLPVLANAGVTAPIIGTTSLEKLKDNIGRYLY